MESRRCVAAALLIAVLLCGAATATSVDLPDDFDEDQFEEEVVEGGAGNGIDASEGLEGLGTKLADEGQDSSASEDLLLDEDEFEGLGGAKTLEDQKRESMPSPPQKAARGPGLGTSMLGNDNYAYEILALSFLVVFGINFFSGKRANELIARSFETAYRDFFEKNFSVVGVPEQGAYLEKEAQHLYRIYASGRVSCKFMLANLELVKRQDLVAVLWGYISPSRDFVTFEFVLEEMPPIIFAVLPRRQHKSIIANDLVDLKLCHITRPAPELKDTHVVVTDCGELIERVFGKEVCKILNTYGEYFESIYFSDQSSIEFGPKIGRVKLRLPEPAKMAEIQVVVKMAFHLLDTIVNHRMSPAAKTRSEQIRAKAVAEKLKTTMQERQEALQQKKIEQQKALLERMTPEERAKKLEKDKKREMRKRMSKQQKVIIG